MYSDWPGALFPCALDSECLGGVARYECETLDLLLGIPHSLIYAGIWPLAIKNLGKWTNLGSSILVMALCGNAVMTLSYGALADKVGLDKAYWLLIPCFAYMIYLCPLGIQG